MTIRDSLAPVISDGDQLNEGYFNENFLYLTSFTTQQYLVSEINRYFDGGTVSGQNLIIRNVPVETGKDFVSVTDTTCTYGERGLVAFAPPLFLFDDVSDEDSWTFTKSGSIRATAQVSGGRLRVESRASGNSPPEWAEAISNGSSNPFNLLNLAEDCELLFNYRLFVRTLSGGSASIRLQVSNGSTHVPIRQFSIGINNLNEEIGFLRVRYNHAADELIVSRLNFNSDGELQAETSDNIINISSVTTNRFLRIRADTNRTGTGSVIGATADCELWCIGIIKASDGTVTTSLTTEPVTGSDLYKALIGRAETLEGEQLAIEGRTTDTGVFENISNSVGFLNEGDHIQLRMSKEAELDINNPSIPILKQYGALYFK